MNTPVTLWFSKYTVFHWVATRPDDHNNGTSVFTGVIPHFETSRPNASARTPGVEPHIAVYI